MIKRFIESRLFAVLVGMFFIAILNMVQIIFNDAEPWPADKVIIYAFIAAWCCDKKESK